LIYFAGGAKVTFAPPLLLPLFSRFFLKNMIKHIKASNLLSFGPDGLDLELQNLNVLIGANGSGKSNFLEIFEVLRSLPKGIEDNNVERLISESGGFSEWVWKGPKSQAVSSTDLEITLKVNKELTMKHRFSLDLLRYQYGYSLLALIYGESIESVFEKQEETVIHFKDNAMRDDITNQMVSIERRSPYSVLSEHNSSFAIYVLRDEYERIRLYREWSFGRKTALRYPQRADMRNDRLEADFSNLGMFLSRLRKDPLTKRALITALQELYDGITDFEVIAEGGAVQIFLNEGDFSIPATRLSDGTLRYLCLIALLLDPTPPPLICIEEPELGLHPDIIPKLADLLVDASKRTQLVVTTHSDMLIDALSDQPESVLVCEKEERQTYIKRLKQSELSHWLKDYRLGDLWLSGEIGGKRW